MVTNNNHSRKLIYIPILHTEQDMGSFALSMKQVYTEKLGDKLWKHHTRSINEMWTVIRTRIFDLPLDYTKTYLYQDGLPLCGKEEAIINDLAEKGSTNHKILKKLIKRGAIPMGTESPELLIEEYRALQKIFQSHNDTRKVALDEYKKMAPELLKKRDEFIGNRINSTLANGTTGLLFIGLLHRIDELLPADIQVSYFIHRLPFKRSFEMELIT